MTTATSPKPLPLRYVVVGGIVKHTPLKSNRVKFAASAEDIRKFYLAKGRRLAWITQTEGGMEKLIRVALEKPKIGRLDTLYTVVEPRAEAIPTINALFTAVGGPGTHWLPKEEVVDVLANPKVAPSHVFLAVANDPQAKRLTLARGDGRSIVVPYETFKPSGNGIRPDFGSPRLTDYGHTLKLGQYEASADAILYDFDPAYRSQKKKVLKASDPSFGACLRRLRLKKKVLRGDFPGVDAKTIARIERGTVISPHAETLDVICARLGVKKGEITKH